MRKFDIPAAIGSLHPGAQWMMRGDAYDGLEWRDPSIPKPTMAEIQAEIDRLQAAEAATEYQRLRAKAYPPMVDYLDAMVKGDAAGVQAYIDACQAVKAKYPKPTSQG